MLEKLEKKLIEVKKFSSDLSLIDSEKRKFVDSMLLSVIIGQSSNPIVSDLIPLLFKMKFSIS